MTLIEFRDGVGKRVDAAFYADAVTVVTRNGEVRAVLVSPEMYRRCVTPAKPPE